MWTMSVLWLFFLCASVFGGDVGEKLILTPYIEAGEIGEAQSLSRVKSLVGDVRSHSGYFTLNKTCNSNMFFWYFPAQNKDPDAPLIIWLQGGPGGTSLYGLFVELGPYELTPENKLVLREYSWSREASLLFFDNPVGAGYSFTERDACYATNEVTVGNDLLNALKQFMKLFPEQADNPVFVTGESYAGKYVPALSYAIHRDVDPDQKINLKGLAIGNGMLDPVNQLVHSDYLYQLGLFDEDAKERALQTEENCQNLIDKEKWMEAFNCFDSFINGARVKDPTFFTTRTGFTYYYNFLYPDGQPEGNLDDLVTSDSMRKRIHVGNATWHNITAKEVEARLLKDVMKDVMSWVETLVEHYRVLMYTGQLDVILPYPSLEALLLQMTWSGADDYQTASRRIWHVDMDIAGYVKTVGNLTEVMVRNAGHMVPRDQPKWAFDMISRFIKNRPFY